jgi:hypothetical protein
MKDDTISIITTVDCRDRRVLDVLRRVEVGFSRREPDHVAALGFQLSRHLRDCNRG